MHVAVDLLTIPFDVSSSQFTWPWCADITQSFFDLTTAASDSVGQGASFFLHVMMPSGSQSLLDSGQFSTNRPACSLASASSSRALLEKEEHQNTAFSRPLNVHLISLVSELSTRSFPGDRE